MLSKYFTIEEVTYSNHKSIDNTMSEIQTYNVGFLCTSILDKVREHFKQPLICSSIFRSYALNRKIGGSITSQHLGNNGAAADIIECGNHSLMSIFEYIKDNLDFDQMLIENVSSIDNPSSMKWLHVSKKMKGNRKQILIMHKGKYFPYVG
jgi:zinc D-Ala-D-Ala carboxypeptidase